MSINANFSYANLAMPPSRGKAGENITARSPLKDAEPTEVFSRGTGSPPEIQSPVQSLPAVGEKSVAQPAKVPTNNAPVVLSMEPEAAQPGPSGVKELGGWSDTLKTVDSYKASILVLGFGSKGQYKDPEAAEMALDKVADQLDAEYGKGKWLAVFGGDSYKADAPDVASMVKHLQEQRSVPVLALQSDKVKEWGGVDKHLDYVHYVPTTIIDSTGPDGTVTSKVAWGGFIDGKPVGPTAAYLGDDFVGGKNPRLKGVVAVGGGEIAGQEAVYAKQHGVPVHYIRAEAKFDVPGGKFGAIDGMLGT
ncbi:hypothetical protein IV102_33650 [bacterium]|nr:hypothetical protein [bacterium]